MSTVTSVALSFVREVNQRAILKEIYLRGTTSRTKLAKKLLMSKPAITDNLSDLLELGIVNEVGEGTCASGGGRRPRLLKFNNDYRHIIAIDLNYSNPIFVLGNLNGEIINEFDLQVSPKSDLETCLTIVKNGVRLLLASRGLGAEDLVCITIASPGVFDENGALCSRNPAYEGVPWHEAGLCEVLEQEFSTSVIIKNDIKAATLGEWNSGSGENVQSMLYISCGIGLGSGIILDSKLYEGKGFTAGEIFAYTDSERLARKATVENDVCLQNLLRMSHESAPETNRCGWGVDEFLEAYRSGDADIRNIVRWACREIGIIALNCANLLAVEKVVFGGEYTVFGDTLLEEFESLFRERRMSPPLIGLSALGKYAGIQGLFYIARERCFDTVCKRTEGKGVLLTRS